MKSITKNRRIIVGVISAILVLSMILGSVMTAFADETKILTLGADLTEEQKQLIIDYLGVNLNEVEIVTVNNQDEHQYLGGIIPDQKIGTHTYSCCYIEPTNDGGIHIKTVNLNYVDSDMIRNALITSGINNANVICVSPKPVSGTGAMVGVFKAYESIEGENLDSEKVEIASEELVTTVELSEEVGKEEASDMMNELKQQVIEEGGTLDRDAILDKVDKYVTEHQLNLTEEQKWKIVDILLKIAQQDYDIDEVRKSYNDLKDTIADVKDKAEKTKNFLEKIVDFITELWQKFTGTYEEIKEDERVQMLQNQLGILANTNDSLLGDDTVVTNTEDQTILDEIKDSGIVSQEDKQSFWESIVGFFKSLRGNKEETPKEEPIETQETETTDGITFDSFNDNSLLLEEDSSETVDFSETSEEEEDKSNLDYVTYELQELDPSQQDEQQKNDEPEGTNDTGVKSFDELTK